MKIIMLILGFILSACSTTQQTVLIENHVVLGTVQPKNNPVIFTLTAPPKKLANTTHTHLIKTVYQNQQHKFIAQIEYTADKMSLGAMSHSGIPLFDFIWQKNTPIQLNEYVSLTGLNVNFVIADIQWVNWPYQQLNSSIDHDLVTLTQEQNPDSDSKSDWVRLLKASERVILKVSKFDKVYFLENRLKKYTIQITDLGSEL